MSRFTAGRLFRFLLGGFVAGLGAVSPLMAQTRSAASDPVTAGPGWKFEVAATNLPQIDHLAMGDDGALYATQELSFRAGKVIRFQRGGITTVVSGLNRPDGLLRDGNKLFITEEIFNGRVLEHDLSSKKSRVLARLNRPEGVDMLPDGSLVVSEDANPGRLMRVRRDVQGRPEVILGGLKRPEGLIVMPDGAIVFAETATGRVLSYKDGTTRVVVDGLSDPDQVERDTDGALWITEDVSDGRLLRFKDGTIETVLSGLRSSQGMAFEGNGAVWLAERGRQRLLVIHRHDLR